MRSPEKLACPRGFTLPELMVVVAVLAVLSAMAAPMVTRYQGREFARSNAQILAGTLTQARARAVSEGTNMMVYFANPMIFFDPITGNEPAIITVVPDVDGNLQPGPVNIETPINVFPASETPLSVSPYSAGFFQDGLALPAEDASPPPVPANLGNLVNGTTFGVDGFTGLPALVFNSRGIPVSFANPTTPGSGAGAFYITDNVTVTYAVIVQPLGGVRIRALLPDGSGTWQ